MTTIIQERCLALGKGPGNRRASEWFYSGCILNAKLKDLWTNKMKTLRKGSQAWTQVLAYGLTIN